MEEFETWGFHVQGTRVYLVTVLGQTGLTVLLCAIIAGHFAWPPFHQASAGIILSYSVATVAGVITVVMFDRLVWRHSGKVTMAEIHVRVKPMRWPRLVVWTSVILAGIPRAVPAAGEEHRPLAHSVRRGFVATDAAELWSEACRQMAETSEKVSSFRATWVQSQSLEPSSFAEAGSELRRPDGMLAGLTTQKHHILTVAGKKARLQTETLQSPIGKYMKGNATFDGEFTRAMGVFGDERRAHAFQSRQSLPVMNNVEYIPVYAALGRVELVTGFGTFPSPEQVTTTLVTLDGREVLKAEFVPRGGNSTSILWLDPAQHLSIIRLERRKLGDEKPIAETTISYVDCDIIVKRPATWTSTTHFSDKSVTIAGTVSSLEVNPQVADSEFSTVFPPGTRFTDMVDRTHKRVHESGSIESVLTPSP